MGIWLHLGNESHNFSACHTSSLSKVNGWTMMLLFSSFPQTEKWRLFNSLDSEEGNLLLKKERETLVDIYV